jgi:hypothetical protein
MAAAKMTFVSGTPANLGSSCLTVTKSQAVSKPLCQIKECSVFKHTYALQEVLARGLQGLRVHKYSTCHLMASDVPHHAGHNEHRVFYLAIKELPSNHLLEPQRL